MLASVALFFENLILMFFTKNAHKNGGSNTENLFSKISYYLSFALDMYIKCHRVGFKAISVLVNHEWHSNEDLGFLIGAIVITVAIILLDLFLILCMFFICQFHIHNLSIKLRTHEITRAHVITIVIEKDDISNYSYPKLHFMSYFKLARITTLKYDYPESSLLSLEVCFDDKKLFENYKVNDEVSVILVQRFDKNKKVIHRTLELPE